MGNRIYLYCTSFEKMPRKDQWDDFFKSSGTEYEAEGCIPFLWLALFDSSCIHIDPADRNGFSEDDRAYAYLIGQKDQCLQRIGRLLDAASQQPSSKAFITLQEWIDRLNSEQFQNIIVRTEELDWMGSEGALEKEMRKALKHVGETLSRKEIKFSNAVCYLCGLNEHDEFHNCEPSWLVGCANEPIAWPASASNSTDTSSSTTHKRGWWKLWA